MISFTFSVLHIDLFFFCIFVFLLEKKIADLMIGVFCYSGQQMIAEKVARPIFSIN